MKQGKFKIKLYKDNHEIRIFLDLDIDIDERANLIKSAPELLVTLEEISWSLEQKSMRSKLTLREVNIKEKCDQAIKQAHGQ